MPIYEYKCPSCGTFEVMQGINEKQLAKCPKCKSKVKKLISETSFQLKGSGWYATDYGKSNGNGNGKAKKPAETTPSACEGCSKKEKGTESCAATAASSTGSASTNSSN